MFTIKIIYFYYYNILKGGVLEMEEERWRKIKAIEEKLDEMWKDPNLWKEVEEFQRVHGELTGEELRERFTI